MDAPKKFQVPDFLTSNHSLRKLRLIYTSINDFAILDCYNDHKFYCWTCMFYIFSKNNWSDMMGVGGGVYSGLVYHDLIRVEMHKSIPNLQTLHKVCWQWGCNGVCHGVSPSRTMTTTKMKENHLTAHVRSFKTFDLWVACRITQKLHQTRPAAGCNEGLSGSRCCPQFRNVENGSGCVTEVWTLVFFGA